jgi:transcriptional regulator EpsA
VKKRETVDLMSQLRNGTFSMLPSFTHVANRAMRLNQVETVQPMEPLLIDPPGEPAVEREANVAETLDVLQLEALMLNLDASLRIYTRPHFFSWTQGLLQSLIRHEVLICALPGGEPRSFRVDSFSTVAAEPQVFSEAFLRDATVAPSLMKAWEERHFRPVVVTVDSASPFAGANFGRELERIGATQLFAHGTHGADGEITGFFAFACAPLAVGPRQEYFTQLVVPFLHAAWVRTQINGRTKATEGMKTPGVNNITMREQEILRWIYLGKSNFEIGAILSISPLTVKNHVQKILRKLNVINRTQAIGKALELRILNP